MDDEARREVLKLLSYGLYTVTVQGRERANAFTANWVTQVSFAPPMVAVAVENDSLSIELLRETGVFAVNVLDAEQRPLASFLARPSRNAANKLSGVAFRPGETGCPILEEALGYLECRMVGTLPAGDHTLVVGEVMEAGLQRREAPLTLAEAGLRYQR